MNNNERSSQNIEDVEKHWDRFRNFICPEEKSFDSLISKDPFDSAAPKLDGLTMLLKAHLLFEEVLNGIITDALAIDEVPKPNAGGLSFFQKLKLVEKMIKQSRKPPKKLLLIARIETINSGRNLLSHRLHDDLDLKGVFEMVVKEFEKGSPVDGKIKAVSEIERRLLRALTITYFSLTYQRLVLQQLRLCTNSE